MDSPRKIKFKFYYWLIFLSGLASVSGCDNEVEPRYDEGTPIQKTVIGYPSISPWHDAFLPSFYSPLGNFICVPNKYGEGRSLILNKDGEERFSIEGVYFNPPQWSPNEMWLAASLFPRKGMIILNSQGQLIFKIANTNTGFAWSTDSKWIVFFKEGKLFKMSVPKGEMIELANGFNPMWSPKDNTILISRWNSVDGNSIGETWSVDAETGTSKFLFTGFAISWFPDGNKVLVKSYGTFSVFKMAENDLQKVTLSVQDSNFDFRLSPDGSRVLFSTFRDFYIVNVDGSGLRKILPNRHFYKNPQNGVLGFLAYGPTWHPSGNMILYTHVRMTKYYKVPKELYCSTCEEFAGILTLNLLEID